MDGKLGSLGVSVVKKALDFKALREVWTDLLKASNNSSLHLTWPFVNAWVRIYIDDKTYKLRVILVSNGSDVVGIAPLMIALRRSRLGVPYRELRFLCESEEVGFDYLGFLVKSGMEKEVLPLIREEMERMDVDRIDLRNTCYSELSQVVPGSRVRSESISRYAPLPKTWEEYFAGRAKNFKQNLRTFRNRCRKDGVPIEFLTCGEEISFDKGFNELKRLNLERWGMEGEAFKTEKYTEFQREVMQEAFRERRLILKFLLIGSDMAAANYSMRHKDTVFVIQMGRSPEHFRYGVGHLLMAEVIKNAMQDGVRKVNFLRGDSFYKQCWADATHEFFVVDAQRTGFVPLLLLAEDLLVLIYRKLTIAAPRLKQLIKK